MADSFSYAVAENMLRALMSGVMTVSIHTADGNRIDEVLFNPKLSSFNIIELLYELEFTVPGGTTIRKVRLNNYNTSGKDVVFELAENKTTSVLTTYTLLDLKIIINV